MIRRALSITKRLLKPEEGVATVPMAVGVVFPAPWLVEGLPQRIEYWSNNGVYVSECLE
jgi:hypothetical protein